MNTILFKDYFKLKQREDKLKFVNIPINTDIEQYIDALVLSHQDGIWYAEANNLIVDFFEELINAIKQKDDSKALYLLGNLSEPNETHFGFSSNMPDGCGIGNEQALFILKRLKKSKAVQTGHLKDLSDCELLIQGIGSDKISDITTNVIRGKLIEFTEEQCKLHNIPTKTVMSNGYWSAEDKKWTRRLASLPHYNNKPILLVPKNIVRYKTTSNYRVVYERIIEYLQSWNLDMNTSLVRVLKNGRRYVPKKTLKDKYKCSKEFIFEFIEENPEILDKYKRTRK